MPGSQALPSNVSRNRLWGGVGRGASGFSQLLITAYISMLGGKSGAVPSLAPNPMMLGLTGSAYVLRAVSVVWYGCCVSGLYVNVSCTISVATSVAPAQLSSVRASDLESALLMLPFTDALRLLGYLPTWLEQGSAIELSTRVAVLLLRLHHSQLVATASARPLLLKLHKRLHPAVQYVLAWFCSCCRLQRPAQRLDGASQGSRAVLRGSGMDGYVSSSWQSINNRGHTFLVVMAALGGASKGRSKGCTRWLYPDGLEGIKEGLVQCKTQGTMSRRHWFLNFSSKSLEFLIFWAEPPWA
eukprot:1143845-Pelagomonas_calceolata.AAC.5